MVSEQSPPPLDYATPPRRQADDVFYLRVLAICYWVVGGGGAISVTWVWQMMARTGGDRRVLFLLFAFWALVIACGFCLYFRRLRALCFFVAVLMLPGLPLGTMLGLFTIGVLVRRGVRQLFRTGQSPMLF